MKGGRKKKGPAIPLEKSNKLLLKKLLKKKKKKIPAITNDQSTKLADRTGSINKGWDVNMPTENRGSIHTEKRKSTALELKRMSMPTENRGSIYTEKRKSTILEWKQILKNKVVRKKKKLSKKKRKGKHVQKLDFEPFEEIKTNVLSLIPDEDLVGFNRNIHCLRLTKEAQGLMGCEIGKDLTVENNWKYISRYIMVYDIIRNIEKSQFFHIYGPLERAPTDYALIVHDKNLHADYLFICMDPITPIQNLSRHLIAAMYSFVCMYRIKFRNLIRYFTKRTWKTKREIKRSKVRCSRPLMKVSHFLEKNYLMTREVILTSEELDSESEMSLYTLVMKLRLTWCDPPPVKEIEENVDVELIMPLRESSMQICGYKRIEGTQTPSDETQDEETQMIYPFFEENMLLYGKFTGHSKLCDKILSFGIQDYMQMDLYTSNLHGFRHTRQESKKIALIPEEEPLPTAISSIPDPLRYVRQKFRIMMEYWKYDNISCVAWHPKFIDLLAISYRGYIHVDKHYYLEEIHETEEFEEEPIPDYEIVIWKITTDVIPMKIIYCECEIRCLQFNEDYPSLLAGANSCGQIYLWDLNSYPVIESEYIDVMKAKFESMIIPWIYIPSSITYITIESSETSSHSDFIYDLQWIPSENQIRNDDGSVDLSGKDRPGQLITASADGTIGIWSLGPPPQAREDVKKRKGKVSKVTPDIEPFTLNDRHMKPVKYVLATMNSIPVPVTSVSVNNMHQWVVPGRLKTNYFSYRSMRNAMKKQRAVMHACITAGLGDGQVMCAMPDLKYYAKIRFDLDMKKELNWTPIKASHIQGQCFKHEGFILCLKRNHYADDVMLSVSSSSCCLWKEQSSLYKERQEKMPWLKRWYSEEVDAPPPSVRILPVWWRRTFKSDTQYINGEWLPEQSNQFILLLSDGTVEVYDTTYNEGGPAMSVLVGCETVNSVLPFLFSTTMEEIGFVEDELLYQCKIPYFCQLKKDTDVKYMQKFICHETWRRNNYAAWCLQYYHDHEELVRKEIEEFEAMSKERRMCRIRARYLEWKLRKAKAKYEENIFEEGELAMPKEWWDKLTNEKVMDLVYKKKMGLQLIELEDIIHLLTGDDLILYGRLNDPNLIDLKYLWKSCLEWRKKTILRYKKEYFKMYWQIRHEQTHAYDFILEEDLEEYQDIAEGVTASSLKAEEGADERGNKYGMKFQLSPSYHALKLKDLLAKQIRLGKGPFGALEVFACCSMFSDYVDNASKKGLFRHTPEVVNVSDDVTLRAPLNRVNRIFATLRMVPRYKERTPSIVEQPLFFGSFNYSFAEMMMKAAGELSD